MKLEVSIVLKINDKEIKLTLEEAQEVYKQLKEFCESNKPIITYRTESKGGLR